MLYGSVSPHRFQSVSPAGSPTSDGSPGGIQLVNTPAALLLKHQRQDIITPEAHKVTTNTRILRWFPCRRRKGGDGVYDEQRKIYLVPACRHKRCRRHWRRYGIDKSEETAGARPQREYWYHLVLSCCKRLKKSPRFTSLVKFMAKVKGVHPEAWGSAVFHEGNHADHIDLLLGVDFELDFDLTRLFWKAHFPAKEDRDWHPQYCTIKLHDDPDYCIAYQFHLKDGKPRIKPPWGKIPFRSPYRLFLPKSEAGVSTTMGVHLTRQEE